MITLGLDLAAQDRNTAACSIEWSASRAVVEPPIVGVSDDRALEMMQGADWCGIGSPFGWPQRFVEAMAAHARGERWPEASIRQLRLRVTDVRPRCDRPVAAECVL